MAHPQICKITKIPLALEWLYKRKLENLINYHGHLLLDFVLTFDF